MTEPLLNTNRIQNHQNVFEIMRNKNSLTSNHILTLCHNNQTNNLKIKKKRNVNTS